MQFLTFRIDYAHGYKSRERAQAAIEDMFATGEISEGDKPKIEVYSSTCRATAQSVRRYKVTLELTA